MSDTQAQPPHGAVASSLIIKGHNNNLVRKATKTIARTTLNQLHSVQKSGDSLMFTHDLPAGPYTFAISADPNGFVQIDFSPGQYAQSSGQQASGGKPVTSSMIFHAPADTDSRKQLKKQGKAVLNMMLNQHLAGDSITVTKDIKAGPHTFAVAADPDGMVQLDLTPGTVP